MPKSSVSTGSGVSPVELYAAARTDQWKRSKDWKRKYTQLPSTEQKLWNSLAAQMGGAPAPAESDSSKPKKAKSDESKKPRLHTGYSEWAKSLRKTLKAKLKQSELDGAAAPMPPSLKEMRAAYKELSEEKRQHYEARAAAINAEKQ